MLSTSWRFRCKGQFRSSLDFNSESEHTLELYGLSKEGEGGDFSKELPACLPLVERGVRFVQVFNKGWDHHQNIYGALPHSARKVDQACAALIKDLRQRGLLDDTLVIWGGEFGRTPMVQENNAGTGAKTQPDATITRSVSASDGWGGVKRGFTYGTTDEFGFGITENPVHVHDWHATCLYLLGIDHERLTYKNQGRDFRLTDVHGHVVHDILRSAGTFARAISTVALYESRSAGNQFMMLPLNGHIQYQPTDRVGTQGGVVKAGNETRAARKKADSVHACSKSLS